MKSVREPVTTIVARASAPGLGGVGVIRISGSDTKAIATALLGKIPENRFATKSSFIDESGNALDHGLALFFLGPASYTGEDTLELHCHGSPVVLDQVLKRVLRLGAELARPGEFTERAFLNGKLDLAQAESVADLINSQTQAAAKFALRSLSGVFSKEIDDLSQRIETVRVLVEATIDFSDEPVDDLNVDQLRLHIIEISEKIRNILDRSRPGLLLAQGATIAIAGPPNAGKSSLLNAFAGSEKAIVSPQAGTTRDLIEAHIDLGGIPVHMIDTAGLRASDDDIEVEGVRRARETIDAADLVLCVLDDSDPASSRFELRSETGRTLKQITVFNKSDLSGRPMGDTPDGINAAVAVSAKNGSGIKQLTEAVRMALGFQGDDEDLILARRRHLNVLEKALELMDRASVLDEPELVAEELRLAHRLLGEITGAFSTEDLLGEIFSSFCIGK
ncbi:MAG: tRNA uridine-5-carboxymethylaminomethyl(34) synthesis GTPase MnmE [Proteobacteria bacterium]|nr:tRNA uridine-5-carboxymethylaminomethyl(34) synthesis GTPase MnmE [Pseudomonadota bacterium]MBT4988470.1 tRNA uridine-5-carboxymethylaminomethyl(34) synthesis GTPase MnmE [Pseudomonadota bacterium]MBT5189139.1 tRNA uridine-5-carboxymethylaminomethyl(34) synthesis GTPase MnmE [Pseudomonadota bacterium]MBT5624911.1 tRNA uridine-5-carboxymethylaminomethyl(34) synthesis GTPase MnmE [Pseudomonadota bacterium]MBT6067046.1 tRNA uridine-5-carboxymethylaminomethyl(34) synthesis GTPase MnmE [Pseudomon